MTRMEVSQDLRDILKCVDEIRDTLDYRDLAWADIVPVQDRVKRMLRKLDGTYV